MVYECGGGVHFDDGDEFADGDECGAVDGGWVGERRKGVRGSWRLVGRGGIEGGGERAYSRALGNHGSSA